MHGSFSIQTAKQFADFNYSGLITYQCGEVLFFPNYCMEDEREAGQSDSKSLEDLGGLSCH